MTEQKFFTWHYAVGFHSHSLTVLAKNRDEAVTRLLQGLKEKRILDLEGPYTASIDKVMANGIRSGYNKPAVSVEEFVRRTEPQVTDAEAVISVSALDG